MSSILKSFLFSGTVLLCACSTKPAHEPIQPDQGVPAQSPPYTLERFRDEHKLPETIQRIVLDNPYGDIQLRQTSGSALAIEGVEQRIGEQPRIARIEWREGEAESGVYIRYDGIDPEQPADRRKGRVDLYAFVPPGIPVFLRSDFGEIVVRRIDNPVSARSRTGRITVAAHGTMNVESEQGELRIYPMSNRGEGVNRLRSAGGIVVDVHLQPPLRLDARGRHGVRADFPLDTLSQGQNGLWHATVRLGSDADTGRRFDIESSGGEVLLQSVGAKPDR